RVSILPASCHQSENRQKGKQQVFHSEAKFHFVEYIFVFKRIIQKSGSVTFYFKKFWFLVIEQTKQEIFVSKTHGRQLADVAFYKKARIAIVHIIKSAVAFAKQNVSETGIQF